MDISNMEIQTFRQLRYEKKTVGFYVIKTDVFCFTLPRYFKHETYKRKNRINVFFLQEWIYHLGGEDP